jgi:hypothetical protein
MAKESSSFRHGSCGSGCVLRGHHLSDRLCCPLYISPNWVRQKSPSQWMWPGEVCCMMDS